MLKGKENLIKFTLLLCMLFAGYLAMAWISYSPFDNVWTVSSSLTHEVLNKTGIVGARMIDLLLALFGYGGAVMPFVLALGAGYPLILRQTADLRWRDLVFWLGALLVLIIGISALSGVLFAHTPFYLSGGIVGELFNRQIGTHLGQIGVLLIAMVVTSVGFYFCSGQIVVQLATHLYQWILGGQTVENSRQLGDHLQKDVEIAPLVTNERAIEPSYNRESETNTLNSDLPHGFTRVEDLVRPMPTIYGLKTGISEEELQPAENDSMPSSVAKASMTDLSSFSPSRDASSLPKVNVENVAFPNIRNESPTVVPNISVAQPDEAMVMPQVRLNPQSFTSESAPALDGQLDVYTAKVESDSAISITLTEDVTKEAVLPTVTPTVKASTKIQNNSAGGYPKSYGDSLIHPLLKQSSSGSTMEKPTTPFPTLDLLEDHSMATPQVSEQDIWQTSAKIEQELANFGVKATVEDVLVGPVVTRYEIKPAAGVKASRITGLESDLARALIFKAIRITDVVPGKPYMGIETPNKHRETVWLRDVLASEMFRQSKALLPMALGKDISGEPVVVDMAKMPHLLVAGQTGGGKSVGINTMILSLLFKLSPEQLRLIMIDPKVVELSIYKDIPHLLTPVVTDMKKAENALRWAVEEMERRYLLLDCLAVRNIEGYNEKIKQADAMGMPIPNTLWRPGDTMDALPPALEKMAYIVLVVDELADLMMSAGKQVEEHIMRIAQKARAVGIHLILATQRPSTDVITGVIKANIPSRIAFTVASQIDSRTILDKGGAESLLGQGDMLYSASGSPEIIRVHGAFMTDDDVQRVADNWRARGKPNYIESIVATREDEEQNSGTGRNSSSELDPLFDEIAQFMIDSGNTSISSIQRRFSLGFTRAGRIIDQLEEQGIISAPDSRGRREILAR